MIYNSQKKLARTRVKLPVIWYDSLKLTDKKEEDEEEEVEEADLFQVVFEMLFDYSTLESFSDLLSQSLGHNVLVY